MVATQIAGPSNGGGSLTAAQPVVRTSSADPRGDALSSYSLSAPGALPPAPPTKNEAAADFLSAAVGPAAQGGVTVTLKVADLSPAALTQALVDTGGRSLVWIFRFANGFRDAGAVASWSPVAGFKFGYNDYTTGATPCAGTAAGSLGQDKCVVYPGNQAVAGNADQGTGTITLTLPLGVLHALSGPTGDKQVPSEVAATVGSRLYDGTAFSFANTVSATQDVQSFLYTLDSTPAMDFLVPAAAPPPPTSGSPGGGVGVTVPVAAKLSAQGTLGVGGATFTVAAVADAKTTTVVWVDPAKGVTFKATGVTSAVVDGAGGTATLKGTGTLAAGQSTTFTLTVTKTTIGIVLGSGYKAEGKPATGSISIA
jgi:hypothetical protein